MPWELPPHFSPRLSDTGPNLGYRCDPLLKEKIIAFKLFFNFDFPLGVIVQSIKIAALRHPLDCHSKRSNRKADNNVWYLPWKLCSWNCSWIWFQAVLCLQCQFEDSIFCTKNIQRYCNCKPFDKKWHALQIIGKSRAFHDLLFHYKIQKLKDLHALPQHPVEFNLPSWSQYRLVSS